MNKQTNHVKGQLSNKIGMIICLSSKADWSMSLKITTTAFHILCLTWFYSDLHSVTNLSWANPRQIDQIWAVWMALYLAINVFKTL